MHKEILSCLLLLSLFMSGCDVSNSGASMQRFKALSSANWNEVFHDPCTEDWTEHWTLDGLTPSITNNEQGMTVIPGTRRFEDADHMVLWTKQSFEGDVRIDYEYTRLDEAKENVNILYVQATGSGEGVYAKDISKWSKLREVPAMKTYYNNMNVYHISYAAVERDTGEDYIRARRYMPLAKKGIKGTDLKPDYPRPGMFEMGVPYRITVIKKGTELLMYIRNEQNEMLCHWKADEFPPITEGRIGLRHMWTRNARYRDFRILLLE